ncbi:unnamed protein product [Sphagnum troendelagicum]|uniref:IRS-type PTB domain-containing protein n=1 Tax=Sphagnum troendelagicum TaxID=128251 RepID=A0ABP0UWR5_9BRYO
MSTQNLGEQNVEHLFERKDGISDQPRHKLTLKGLKQLGNVKRLSIMLALVNEDDEILDTPSLVDKQKGIFIFKRKLFHHDTTSRNQEGRDASTAFDFSQAIHEVMSGMYQLAAMDLHMLEALQLRVDLPMTTSLVKSNLEGMEKHGPNDDIEAMGDQGRNELLKTIATLPNEPNKIVRMNDYITFLKSCCPLYQSSWFFVKQNTNPKLPLEIFVAINKRGVYFINPELKDKGVLCHIRFTEICSWGHSSHVASIVTGNMTNNFDHRLITRQGSEIGLTLQLYIFNIQL